MCLSALRKHDHVCSIANLKLDLSSLHPTIVSLVLACREIRMESVGSSGPRSFEELAEGLRAENGCIRSKIEVDYLRLCVEAAERVQELTSPELLRSLHLNGSQCRLLADALSEAIQSAEQETHGMDDASVRLCAPAFRELCRVAGDCEKLVRDCCNENWLAVAILLADSKEDFLLRVSELKWCTRAWRTVIQHGLQRGAWLEQFHKSSKMSIANRHADGDEDSARLKIAAEEDLMKLLAKLEEVGGDSVKTKTRELANYVLSRCKMLAGQPDDEQILRRSEYELRRSGTETIHKKQYSGSVFRSTWCSKDFACKDYDSTASSFDREVNTMIKIGSHPRVVRLLGVHREADRNCVTLELMSSDLGFHTRRRMRVEDGRTSAGDDPFPLHVAVDIMLQIAEGVEVLHKHRLCHRNLKSANILVEPVEMQCLREEGYVRVKLADFGLAEARSKSFRVDKFGSNVYMAPELMSIPDDLLVYGEKADALCFAILCSKVLSGDMDLNPTYVLEGGRPELPGTLPSCLTSLLQRCWDEDPTKRPLGFTSICKELRYLKFLITVGGEMQCRALDSHDKDAESSAAIVKNLPWIEHDKLRFIRHIGSGGYGSVDECEMQGEGRVAVKNLLRCSSKVRVEEEAALLVRVQHQNVVKLVACAFNEDKRKGMIVMELMHQDLHNLISKLRERSPSEPPFSLAVALKIMLNVAIAMKHIRSCNVLHRDLKTTNILIKVMPESHSNVLQTLTSWVRGSSKGACYEVKLADLGLSKYKLRDSMFTTKASEAQLWRAPEMSTTRNYSWPADVFSFGVVCYEILTGEVAFNGMQGDELLRVVLSGKRPKMPACYPTIVAELVDACWATDPKDRPDFVAICTKLQTLNKSKK